MIDVDSILEKASEETGWDVNSQLCKTCQFIEEQDLELEFKEFIARQIEEENAEDMESDLVALCEDNEVIVEAIKEYFKGRK